MIEVFTALPEDIYLEAMPEAGISHDELFLIMAPLAQMAVDPTFN